jgi:hypothetical protein
MAPCLATQQGKEQSSKSTTSWDAYVGVTVVVPLGTALVRLMWHAGGTAEGSSS